MIKLLKNLINPKKKWIKNISVGGKIYTIYKSEPSEYFFEEEKDPNIHLKEMQEISYKDLLDKSFKL
jgi:hypothetical protein